MKTKRSFLSKTLAIIMVLTMLLGLTPIIPFAAWAAVPEVESVSPSGADASLSGDLVITFSEEMDDESDGTVELIPSVETPVAIPLMAGTWSEENTIYTVAYGSPALAYGTEYVVSISGFESAEGDEMVLDDSNKFTTIADPDIALVGKALVVLGDSIEVPFGTIIASGAGAEAASLAAMAKLAKDEEDFTGVLAEVTWDTDHYVLTVTKGAVEEEVDPFGVNVGANPDVAIVDEALAVLGTTIEVPFGTVIAGGAGAEVASLAAMAKLAAAEDDFTGVLAEVTWDTDHYILTVTKGVVEEEVDPFEVTVAADPDIAIVAEAKALLGTTIEIPFGTYADEDAKAVAASAAAMKKLAAAEGGFPGVVAVVTWVAPVEEPTPADGKYVLTITKGAVSEVVDDFKLTEATASKVTDWAELIDFTKPGSESLKRFTDGRKGLSEDEFIGDWWFAIVRPGATPKNSDFIRYNLTKARTSLKTDITNGRELWFVNYNGNLVNKKIPNNIPAVTVAAENKLSLSRPTALAAMRSANGFVMDYGSQTLALSTALYGGIADTTRIEVVPAKGDALTQTSPLNFNNLVPGGTEEAPTVTNGTILGKYFVQVKPDEANALFGSLRAQITIGTKAAVISAFGKLNKIADFVVFNADGGPNGGSVPVWNLPNSDYYNYYVAPYVHGEAGRTPLVNGDIAQEELTVKDDGSDNNVKPGQVRFKLVRIAITDDNTVGEIVANISTTKDLTKPAAAKAPRPALNIRTMLVSKVNRNMEYLLYDAGTPAVPGDELNPAVPAVPPAPITGEVWTDVGGNSFQITRAMASKAVNIAVRTKATAARSYSSESVLIPLKPQTAEFDQAKLDSIPEGSTDPLKDQLFTFAPLTGRLTLNGAVASQFGYTAKSKVEISLNNHFWLPLPKDVRPFLFAENDTSDIILYVRIMPTSKSGQISETLILTFTEGSTKVLAAKFGS